MSTSRREFLARTAGGLMVPAAVLAPTLLLPRKSRAQTPFNRAALDNYLFWAWNWWLNIQNPGASLGPYYQSLIECAGGFWQAVEEAGLVPFIQKLAAQFTPAQVYPIYSPVFTAQSLGEMHALGYPYTQDAVNFDNPLRGQPRADQIQVFAAGLSAWQAALQIHVGAMTYMRDLPTLRGAAYRRRRHEGYELLTIADPGSAAKDKANAGNWLGGIASLLGRTLMAESGVTGAEVAAGAASLGATAVYATGVGILIGGIIWIGKSSYDLMMSSQTFLADPVDSMGSWPPAYGGAPGPCGDHQRGGGPCPKEG